MTTTDRPVDASVTSSASPDAGSSVRELIVELGLLQELARDGPPAAVRERVLRRQAAIVRELRRRRARLRRELGAHPPAPDLVATDTAPSHPAARAGSAVGEPLAQARHESPEDRAGRRAHEDVTGVVHPGVDPGEGHRSGGGSERQA